MAASLALNVHQQQCPLSLLLLPLPVMAASLPAEVWATKNTLFSAYTATRVAESKRSLASDSSHWLPHTSMWTMASFWKTSSWKGYCRARLGFSAAQASSSCGTVPITAHSCCPLPLPGQPEACMRDRLADRVAAATCMWIERQQQGVEPCGATKWRIATNSATWGWAYLERFQACRHTPGPFGC